MFVQKISRNNYRDTYNLKKIILIADIEILPYQQLIWYISTPLKNIKMYIVVRMSVCSCEII